ncbi:MAG: ABC transporter substrate-binding protein [Acetobacteraceae bacterium]
MTMPLVLRTAIGNYDHVRALKDGTVGSERVRLDFVEVEPITRAFRRMVRGMEFDVCEIALATHAQAHAAGKPLTALPVVLMRGFHHGAIVCEARSDLRGPADLVGRRIGVRAYSQTTGVWVRGILHADYGIDPATITWITEEDAHVQEYQDPPNVLRVPPGRSLREMLLAREIDAAIGLRGMARGEARTVIPDADAAASAWFRGNGVYPVNHVVAVRDALLMEHPWLAEELFRLFSAAKAARLPVAARTGVMALVGGDPLPYGMAANRTSIDLLLAFTARQGLTRDTYRAEQLFATRLNDST